MQPWFYAYFRFSAFIHWCCEYDDGMKALALTGFLLVFVLARGFAFYSVAIDERGYGRGK